jgi:hypothetical protein
VGSSQRTSFERVKHFELVFRGSKLKSVLKKIEANYLHGA